MPTRFEPFSEKQLAALCWWCDKSPYKGRDAIICDGAVRSGKTLCLSLSFILWSFARFENQNFALCGKTVTSLRRNLVMPLMQVLGEMGFTCEHKISQGILLVSYQGRQNRYYLFGGKDEGSAALIQGITLAGILLDEVALMPRSFVEQALARCSVEGSKFWFNCNPEHPFHWFYTEWIKQHRRKNVLYLHFCMEDNPSLSPAMLARYRTLYTGVFYERYVLGKWVAAHGAVYPMFNEAEHVVQALPVCERYIISCDYGTVNPASFGLWGLCEGIWYRMREYYYHSRTQGVQKTDEEYADALEELAGGLPVEVVLVDPSAASFIQCLRRRGHFKVLAARNDVPDGIRMVSGALKEGKLRFCQSCRATLREFSLYRWDLDARGDLPMKENDHAMDDMRYFVLYAFGESGGVCAVSAPRRG